MSGHTTTLEERKPMVERTVDTAEFRKHVSRFATGVAVISCVDDDRQVHGATVNSFVSLSLDPPTVMVSLRPGRAHDIVRKTGRYAASVLLDDQQHCSNHFARQRDGERLPEFTTRERVPTLNECLAWFECEVVDEVAIHDHVLFIGRVTACGSGDGTPLIFYASKYHGPPTPVETLANERR